MPLIRYTPLLCLLIASVPARAQDPAPRPARLVTRAQVRSAEMPGIRLDYMDVIWNETAFEVFENGGALAFAQRPWFLARLELGRAIRLDDTDVAPGTYALVAHANRGGEGTSLEVRQVPPSTTLERGVVVEVPEGPLVYQRKVSWERVASTTERAQLHLEAIESGGRIVALYGNRRMVQPFRLAPGP